MGRNIRQIRFRRPNAARQVLLHQLQLCPNADERVDGSLERRRLSDQLGYKGRARRLSFILLQQKRLRGYRTRRLLKNPVLRLLGGKMAQIMG
jgi:hypothetical protein